jgi:hypothetical protein
MMSAKGIKIILWGCVAILAVQFIAAGVGKLAGLWTVKFANWGYSISFMYLIGLMEIAGVAGLFFNRTREWSAFALMSIMFGAAYTVVVHGEGIRVIHHAVIGILLLSVIVLSRRLKPK